MEYDVKNGGPRGQISYYQGVVLPIRLLILSSEMGNVEIFEHYSSIDCYLQDEDAVIKLLYAMPQHR